MRILLVLIAAIVVLPAAPSVGQDQSAGEMFTVRCGSCHTVPDPGLRTDLAWLDQINRTTWTSTPKRARVALIAWLKDKDRKRPSRATDGAAVVKCRDAGSVVLAGRGGNEACIVWGKGQPEARIASGRYTVRTTRIERKQGDDHWFLSSCGPAMHKQKKIKLKRGDNTFKLGDTAHFEGMVRGWRDGRLQLGFAIRGKDKRGLSVYKNDKRVPVTYKILTKKGKVLRQGSMNYGWGGGGWAQVGLGDRKNLADRVEYGIETGPFSRKGTLSVRIK